MGIYQDRRLKSEHNKRVFLGIGMSISCVCFVIFVCLFLPLGKFSDFFKGAFGIVSYVLCLIGVLIGFGISASSKYHFQKRYFVYMAVNVLCISALLHTALCASFLKNVSWNDYGTFISNCYHMVPKITIGGALIGIIIFPFACLLGVVGACVLFGLVFCIFVGLSVDFLLVSKSQSRQYRKPRTIYQEKTSASPMSDFSEDNLVSAKRIVPKKYEEEDEERYSAIRKQNENNVSSFSSRINIAFPKRDSFQDVQPSVESVENDQYFFSGKPKIDIQETPINSAENDQMNIPKPQQTERSVARNVLFGNRVSSDDIARASSDFDPNNEVFPSRFDSRLFKDKKEYIRTPILPDYLNQKTRKPVERKDDSSNRFSAWNGKTQNIDSSNVKTPHVEAFENELDDEEVEDTVSPIIQNRQRQRITSDNFPRHAIAEIPKEEPALPVDSLADDEEDDEPISFDIPRRQISSPKNEAVSGISEPKPVLPERKVQYFSNFDESSTFERKAVGVRGRDLQQRKTPDRRRVGSNLLSDMVEGDSNDDSFFQTSFQNAPQSFSSQKPKQEQLDLIPKPRSPFAEKPVRFDAKYIPFPLSLLTVQSDDPSKYGGDYQKNSKIIEETLDNFRIPAKVTNVVRGPSVTRYEISIARGIPVNRLSSYEKDLAMALMSKNGIRMEIPIPGKNAVGIEIPNEVPSTIGLKELLESKEYVKCGGALPVSIGKNISGEVVCTSLAKLVHTLVAGSTGSGKSVFLHSLIISLMYNNSPDQLRFIIIDPKRVEFSVYNNMPHLMLPNVLTECDKAINALGWAVKEMDRRFTCFQQNGAQNIEAFNTCDAIKSGDEQKIPYIVIIVDELADLMMLGKKDVEEKIRRLAQLGRAAGIHLIIATQRPSVEVVTGTIKTNMPTRIAFALASFIDSKTILDEAGAEKLLGRGDMLYSPQSSNVTTRLQAAFVSNSEVKNIIQYLKDHNASTYDENVSSAILTVNDNSGQSEVSTDSNNDGLDEYFYPALRYFIETGSASTSMLQRKFEIGFNRAGRLVDQMELKGYLSPQNGSKKRNVYLTMDQYREISGDED